MKSIQKFDDLVVNFVKFMTAGFIHTKAGKLFLGLALVGPLTFIPTVWVAWTAVNIDSLRTLTWPLMVLVNIAVLVGLCYSGDWRLRLSIVLWIALMTLVWLATVFR